MVDSNSNLSLEEEQIYSKWNEQAQLFLAAETEREERALIELNISRKFKFGASFFYVVIMIFCLLQIAFGALLLLCQLPQMHWLRGIFSAYL